MFQDRTEQKILTAVTAICLAVGVLFGAPMRAEAAQQPQMLTFAETDPE